MRYPSTVTNAVANLIGRVNGTSAMNKEATGFNNMATLMRYNRDTKGRIPPTDYTDPNFRMAVKAKNAKADYLSKNKKKNARSDYYQSLSN